MKSLKILLVEDNAEDIKTCVDSANVFQVKNDITIKIEVCKNENDALRNINNTYDGAIIDLKLGKDSNAGAEVIRNIAASFFRIPLVIITATPDSADGDFEYIEVIRKGEVNYHDLFDNFLNIYNTGLTRIMGGRGKIEETLASVFMKNILPQKDIWIDYGKKDNDKTEKALLRYILNHLLLLLDDDDPFFPEELYIYPQITDQLYTGSIIRKKENAEVFFVVLTPACDLVIRSDGKFRTDRILLIEVDNFDTYNTTKKDRERRLLNKMELYLHWLPKIKKFNGGFLNFRKISTISTDDYVQWYEKPYIQITGSFVKDIISRFSSYYARQGQPDIDKQKYSF